MVRKRRSAAFTLLELLLVIAVIGILAALVLPSSQPSVHEQLQAAVRIVAADLGYARSLAVANNSKYRFTFDLPNNRYILEHSGTNHSLDVLPAGPFRDPDDPSTQHIVDLDDFPHIGPTVRLVAAVTSGSNQPVSTLEFGPLGSTTATGTTILWFLAGSGDGQRYMTIEVNPVTGLADVGAFTKDGPPE
jgi:prepilin-type N-terminal cleavage/methylation domain-containing protein